MWYGHGGMMWWGWIFWILVIAAVIWIVVRAMSKTKSASGPDSRLQGSAREILDKRYANGEITKEEYEKMKNDLT